MPGQRVRGFPPIRSYPAIERYGFVWVWPGEPALADPAKLHHLRVGREPRLGLRRRALPRQLRLPADDRQPDGPDARDLRARRSIGQKRDRRSAAGDHASKATRSITSRFMNEHHAAAVLAAWRCAATTCADDVPVDRWQICRFSPPSHVMIEVGVAHAGNGGYDAPTRQSRRRASWSTSSRRRPTPRSGTSGAWRATSTRTTRR